MDMSDLYEGWAGAGGRFQLAVRGFSCIEVILMTQLGTLGLGYKAWGKWESVRVYNVSRRIMRDLLCQGRQWCGMVTRQ
jgi:hypothetical protein